MSRKVQSDQRFIVNEPLISKKILEAQDLIKSQIKDLGLEGLAIAFNGGKDCTLVLGILGTLWKNDREIHGFYCIKKEEFKEIRDFISVVEEKYRFLKLHQYSGKDMKAALKEFLEKNRSVKGILIGTRRSDPNGRGLDSVVETDGDWPRVLRIHPLLDWSYNEVWQGICYLGLDYCSLYDEAYTSLGDSESSRRNDKLVLETQLSVTTLPAYLLKEPDSERMGRQ